MHAEHEAPAGIILPALLVVLYMAPTLVALRRGAAPFRRVLLTNLFLGWTMIGWVVALTWALGGAGDERSA